MLWFCLQILAALLQLYEHCLLKNIAIYVSDFISLALHFLWFGCNQIVCEYFTLEILVDHKLKTLPRFFFIFTIKRILSE